MKNVSLAVLVAAVVFVAASDASARSARVNQVPNGLENSCQTCHTVTLPQVGNGPLNDFGMDAESNLTGDGSMATQAVEWSAVCDIDSDGDGFTNGEELGDPDCTWTRGDQPEAYESEPGDASSIPEGGGEDAGSQEDAGGEADAGGEDDAGVAMDAGGEDTGTNGGEDNGSDLDEDEGCSTAGSSAPVSAGLALLGFFLLGAWRRLR